MQETLISGRVIVSYRLLAIDSYQGHCAQIVRWQGVALFRGEQIPFGSFFLIHLESAQSKLIHRADHGLGFIIAFFCEPEGVRRLFGVRSSACRKML